MQETCFFILHWKMFKTQILDIDFTFFSFENLNVTFYCIVCMFNPVCVNKKWKMNWWLLVSVSQHTCTAWEITVKCDGNMFVCNVNSLKCNWWIWWAVDSVGVFSLTALHALQHYSNSQFNLKLLTSTFFWNKHRVFWNVFCFSLSCTLFWWMSRFPFLNI